LPIRRGDDSMVRMLTGPERGDERADARKSARHLPFLRLIDLLEDAVHYLVVILLLVIAGVVLYHTSTEMFHAHRSYATRVVDGIDGVLFVVIIMELLHTVVAHFNSEDFQLQPFLIIGIISAVRHLLSVGAHLTLGTSQGHDAFNRSQIELGVSTGVVVALALALVLIRRIPADASVDR
jgi:uncharacterized membrane protein (DUF373 family)